MAELVCITQRVDDNDTDADYDSPLEDWKDECNEEEDEEEEMFFI